MKFTKLFKKPKDRTRPTKVVEILGLESMAIIFEEKVARATNGITDEVKLRKADRRIRKEITLKLENIVLEIVAKEQPSIVIEIGAHGAEFSKSAKAVLPDSRCIAIEGNPKIHAEFASNLLASRVEYVNACVTDKKTEIEFQIPIYRDILKSSMGSMLRFQEHIEDENSAHEIVKSPGIPLDDFLGSDQHRSNFIWIDVEGAVGSVLAGAEKSLKNCVGLYIEVETEARWEGQTVLARDVYNILSPLGFIPVLRDVQRKKWQHNVLYLHESLASKAYIEKACYRYLHGGN